MTAFINKLKDKTGNQQLPVTHERAVRDDNGTTLETKMQNLEGAMDKAYVASSGNGMGRITLKKNMVSGVNTLTQSMMQATNTIYVIQYDFVLGEDITVPTNCVLEFDGGSILGNYTLTGNNTRCSGLKVQDFLLCKAAGTFINIKGYILDNDYKLFKKYDTLVTVSIGPGTDLTTTTLPQFINSCKNNYVKGIVICLNISIEWNGSAYTTWSLDSFIGQSTYSGIVSLLRTIDIPIYAIKIHARTCYNKSQSTSYMNVYRPAITAIVDGLHSAGLNEITDKIFICNENYLLYSDVSGIPENKAAIEGLLLHIKSLGYRSGIAGFGTWTLKTALQNMDIADIHEYPQVASSSIGYKGDAMSDYEYDVSGVYEAQGQNVEINVLETGVTGHSIALRAPATTDFSHTTAGNSLYDPLGVKYAYLKTVLPVYFDRKVTAISLWFQEDGGFVFLSNNLLKDLMEDYYYE